MKSSSQRDGCKKGEPRADRPMSDEQTANSDPLLTAEQAAGYLGLGNTVKHPGASVRHLTRTRRLASIRVCGKVMVRKSELERFIAENTVEANR